MRSLFFLLEKEFRQLLRNRQLTRVLIIAPTIQLIIMPLAANYTIKDISIAVIDHDHSSVSQKLVSKIKASGYFKLRAYADTYDQGIALLEKDHADLVIQIPANFERHLVREGAEKLYISINAIEGTKANLGGAYLANIIADFNSEIRATWPSIAPLLTQPIITVASSNWYNPFMNYDLYIVPAILVTLVTAMGVMQSAFNIVREKESGTIEQINVTPIKKHIFVLGKLLPFMVLATVVFTLGLGIARVLYHVIPAGSVLVLYTSLIVYLFAVLGLGLLISTFSSTQQQAMSLSFFFINIFNMMSGVFNSVDSMPNWAKHIVETFPPSHFIKIMRMVVLKGSGFSDISYHLGAIALIGLVLNTWAILNYRKTAG